MCISEAKKILGERFAFTADFANQIIQRLRLPKDAKILDVGTGMGSMAITLALNGYEVLTGEPENDLSRYAKEDWLHNAKRVHVDHLIRFKAFDAKDMPFNESTFHAVFFLGSFHHIHEGSRRRVLEECIRVSTSHGIICFFEPNPKAIKIIKESDPSHPDAADPKRYMQGLHLVFQKVEGPFFTAFILEKQPCP